MVQHWICFLSALFLASRVYSSVIGIDLGSEFVKVALVKPGAPFTIVEDEASKRKFPALIGFEMEQRQIGLGAKTMQSRKPARVLGNFHELLGRSYAEETISYLAEQHYPYEIVPAEHPKGGIGFKMDGQVYSVEELMAMIFKYAQQLASTQAGYAVKSAIITVPDFFTHRQRQAVLDAADVSGLNVLGLINENTAAAVQLGIERTPNENETSVACIYNMGSTYTTATVMRFSSYTKNVTRKTTRTVSQVEILGQGYDEQLGGKYFEMMLLDHFASEFAREQGSTAVLTDRIYARLREPVKKLKEILSANSKHPISVESLYEDADFKSMMTRQDFYTLAQPLLDRVTRPVLQALEQAGVSHDNVNQVILIGGGMRIPRVQELLKEAFKRDQLNLNLNADEASALGASIQAANMSSSFRVRELGLVERSPYPIGMRLHSLQDSIWSKRVSLYPKNAITSLGKRSVKLDFAGDLQFNLFYDSVTGALSLPRGVQSDIATYQVTGVQEAIDAYLAKDNIQLADPIVEPRIVLSFRYDSFGTVHCVSARVLLDVEVTTIKRVPIEAVENDTDTEEANTKEEGEEKSEEPTVEYKEEVIKEIKTRRIGLTLKQVDHEAGLSRMTSEDIEASKAKLAVLDEKDALAARLVESINELESFIYASREKARYDEEYMLCSTDAEREALLDALEESEDWIYDSDEPDSIEKYSTKLSELRRLFDPIALRVTERSAFPAAAANLEEVLAAVDKSLGKELSWLPDEDKELLKNTTLEAASFLQEKQALRDALQPHEDPIVFAASIQMRVVEVNRVYLRLKRKRKPVPPKPKKNATNTASKANTTDAKEGQDVPEVDVPLTEAVPDSVPDSVPDNSFDEAEDVMKDEL